MRAALAVVVLSACAPEGAALQGVLEPPADLASASDLATSDMATAVDAGPDVAYWWKDMTPPPDMTDPHFGCIGLKCESPGNWCRDYGVGIQCDISAGAFYCASPGTACHIDADCCTPWQGGNRVCRRGTCL